MSPNGFRYWILAYPDIPKPIGGIKQLHRLAETISSLGRQVTLVQEKSSFHPGWFTSSIDTISKEKWEYSCSSLSPKSDILIIPETFLPELLSISKGLPVVVFNQNSSYIFGAKPDQFIYKPSKVVELYSSSILHHVICVSRHDYDVINKGIGVPEYKLSLIPNAIEIELCQPNLPKKKLITYMSRKNLLDAKAASYFLSTQSWLSGWDLLPIENCSHSEVIHLLQKSLIFLSFGHPEGFGLPVAEALACGCAVVGYSGLGGRELFEIADAYGTSLEVSVGDWLGFVNGVHHFHDLINTNPSSFLASLKSTSNKIRDIYSPSQMMSHCALILDLIEGRL